jgi:hypothetical protein
LSQCPGVTPTRTLLPRLVEKLADFIIFNVLIGVSDRISTTRKQTGRQSTGGSPDPREGTSDSCPFHLFRQHVEISFGVVILCDEEHPAF